MTLLSDLTPREQEVTQLILEGKSNKEIASSLFVSERTVEFHLQNIYNKFQVKSRIELVLKLRASTVADVPEIAENRSEPESSGWVAASKATISKISKEFKMENTLDGTGSITGRPLTFYEAIRTCLTRYADFTGRATRSEFWWFALFVGLVAGALTYVSEAVSSVFLIAVLLPFLAVGTRRLRDSGKSGWWQFLLLVPIGGIIILGFFWAEPGVAPLSDKASAV